MINKYLLEDEIYENIPALVDGVWTTISYNSQEEFKDDLEQNYFKEVGEYNLTKDFHEVLSVRKVKSEKDYYCNEKYGSPKFLKFWDDEKMKCRKGVFVHHGKNKWYISRYLYMWWNFLPIYNKKKKKDQFPDITDAHIRMDLYEFIAYLSYKHAVATKKRQFGWSYYHMARLINQIWFEPSVILQTGASLEKYVHGKEGSWKYLNSYKNYLNKHTAWFRHIDGGDSGPWQQKKKEIDPITKHETESGRMGIVSAVTFERSATNGVGGAKTEFFHEEAGIAPKMDDTYEFIRSALEDGIYTTGFFTAGGSVGDLTHCEPLKKFMYAAKDNGFYAVSNNLIEKDHAPLMTGLFISTVHAMAGFMDEWGNSDVKGAIEHIEKEKEKWARTLDPKAYAIRCSQNPTYLNEAFKFRGESEFPIQLLEAQEKLLISQEKNYELVELEYDPDDEKQEKIISIPSLKPPILVFPLPAKTEDKTAGIVVFEPPIQNLKPLVTYYVSVDPVGQGKTLTSKSLVSILVYRNMHMVTRTFNGDTETVQEGDKIVCSWCGRYDQIEDTHEQLIKIILWYKAWALVENNVSLLIDEMKRRNLQKYLVPKQQFQFGKEFESQQRTHFYEYGWRNTGDIFDRILKNYLLKFLTEVIHKEIDNDGNVTKIVKGVTRINDIMVIREMMAYFKGLNVDRLVTVAALVTFVKLQESHKRGNMSHVHQNEDEENLDNINKNTKLNNSPFRNVGNNNISQNFNKRGNIFKNLK